MVNEETILVRIINKVEGAEQLVKEKNLVSEVTKSNGDLTKTYEEQTATQRKRVTVTEKTNAQGKKQVDVNKETLAQGPKFQAHFLGLMFGGMALNRAMSNLTSTSMEWVGIGDIMSTTMGTVMLPATLELLDTAIIPLSEALLSLPEETKLAIGITAFGLQGFGKFTEFAGQVALAKIAFPVAFAKMTAPIKVMTSTIGGLLIKIGLLNAASSVALGIAAAIAIDNLADYAEAWDKLGQSVETTTEILGQKGQETRTIAAPLFKGEIDFSFLDSEEFKNGDGGKSSAPIKSIDFGQFDETLPAFLDKINTQERLSGARSFAVGGNVTNNGLHFLHEGETVLRSDQAGVQGGNVSAVYNITVLDSRELERMMKANTEKLVREVRKNSII